jgi:hypothetical protein
MVSIMKTTILLLAVLFSSGCGDEAGPPCDASIPGDAAPAVIACAAGRDVVNPCFTTDGTSLRHGECCVVDGNLGTCIVPRDVNDQPSGDPFCDWKL